MLNVLNEWPWTTDMLVVSFLLYLIPDQFKYFIYLILYNHFPVGPFIYLPLFVNCVYPLSCQVAILLVLTDVCSCCNKRLHIWFLLHWEFMLFTWQQKALSLKLCWWMYCALSCNSAIDINPYLLTVCVQYAVLMQWRKHRCWIYFRYCGKSAFWPVSQNVCCENLL